MFRFKTFLGPALALIGAAFASPSQAGQASAELGISLTVANSCQVSSRFDPADGRYQVQSQTCARDGGYRLIHEPAAPLQTGADKLEQRGDAGAGRTLVTLYW
ncbi:hypothetical protein [Metapseudomonas resinovorans]|uniref:Uncharacterized protein n=1 Tax=Metapseudomonas resinovorans NBRC 106553 TaxID=1245471 RepID=S6AX77_METRE|nr:hypothetical protein [Pseudomonas resinovorans]BAN49236.1 hypothetical protein PCA10_35040 [Pseudomonas resinovorans NBRC 106553]